MRRVFATIALLLVGWTSVESASIALLASPTVLVCCSKAGKHHCTGSVREIPEDRGSYLRGASPLCPHRALALIASTHFQFEPLSAFEQTVPQVYSTISPFVAINHRSFNSSELFDRGPPRYTLLTNG